MSQWLPQAASDALAAAAALGGVALAQHAHQFLHQRLLLRLQQRQALDQGALLGLLACQAARGSCTRSLPPLPPKASSAASMFSASARPSICSSRGMCLPLRQLETVWVVTAMP